MKVRVLKRAKSQRGIFAFAMVYNEEWFLPHFLEHHRALGIDYFIFYDDCSTDRTREFLLAQDDCAVHVPDAEPGEEIKHGVWLQRHLSTQIPELEGPGRWSLVLDADEFMILPPAFASIGDVVAHLERKGRNSAFAAMVDFYPERLSDRFYDPLSPLQGCPWFDKRMPFKRDPVTLKPEIVAAGVRPRLLQTLAARYPQSIKEIFGDSRYRIGRMWKVPLLKTGQGIVRTSAHGVNVAVPAGLQLALAHFKFYPELDQRIHQALSREGHFQGGIEYRFLRKVLDLLPDEPLLLAESVEYRSPADLERVGLTWSK